MAFEKLHWCQDFCIKPLFAATRQFFNHPGALFQALDQMETIKLFASMKKKKTNHTQKTLKNSCLKLEDAYSLSTYI